MRVCLKVDVDTYRGMREGLPRMLDLFRERRIPATVFVSMGPDHSGRAIRRILTKRGFLKKMFRTKAVSLYGPRTVLYGTLLPGPRIAEGNHDLFRRIEAEGHEAGVHGWDHVRWQDGLPKFDESTIARELEKAFEVFEAVTGHSPRATAAPGWIATGASLSVQDRLGLLYSSDVRGTHPFLPRIGERTYRTLQIPTTLPTLDELMGAHEAPAGKFDQTQSPTMGGHGQKLSPASAGHGQEHSPSPSRADSDQGSSPASSSTHDVSGPAVLRPTAKTDLGDEGWINDLLVDEARRQSGEDRERPIVHTVHTEVEGLSRAGLFADLLDRLLADGARFERLDTIAGALGAGGRVAGSGPDPPGADSRVPVCEVRNGVLPGRSGMLAVQGAGTAATHISPLTPS